MESDAVESDTDSATATLEAARAHARSQAAAAGTPALTIPPQECADPPAGVAASSVVWDEVVPTGGYRSLALKRHHIVRLVDIHGTANVNLLVYSAANTAERLNVADTVKVQWQAYLGPGSLLLSDMGRVLMTMLSGSSDRHDALCGCSTLVANERRYGHGGVQGPTPAGRELLALAAAKSAMSRRDLAPCLNLFSGARVGDDGALVFDPAPRPGAYVDLRAEMDVVVLMACTPHPLDDRDDYVAGPVRVTAWESPHPGDDPLRVASPERLRAFQNTEVHLLGSR